MKLFDSKSDGRRRMEKPRLRCLEEVKTIQGKWRLKDGDRMQLTEKSERQ